MLLYLTNIVNHYSDHMFACFWIHNPIENEKLHYSLWRENGFQQSATDKI